MTKIDIHSDDYGYSLNTSKDILDCCKNGSLDSFSIIPNMSAFEDSVALLYSEIRNFKYLPKIVVHINLVEGKFKSKYLPLSWGELFLKSFSNNQKLKEEIKKEIKDQINIVNDVFNKCIKIAKENNIEIRQKKLRIDSHVHTHSISYVWEALIEVIEEEKIEIEYIRNPKEPIFPFISCVKLWFTYNPINILKNRILMLYSKKIDDYCKLHNLQTNYMCGLMMSGKMDFDRIKEVYPKFIKYAKKRNRNVEFLFHSGYLLEEEYDKDMNRKYANSFNGSNNRKIEKKTLFDLLKTRGD